MSKWLTASLCQADALKNTGSGVCGFILDSQGNCANTSNHITDVKTSIMDYEVPETYDEEAAMRLLKAIEDPLYHEILQWESEGGSL